MKRNGFSLVELIFVIVLMGVLTGVGFYLSRPDYTRQDAQYALLKLKEARYRAIGFETGNGSCSKDGWVRFEINNVISDQSSDHLPEHEIKSTLSVTQTICFDSLGRPHDQNDTNLSTLMANDLNITFSSSNGKETNITLYSGTGYAIIPCNN